MFLVTYSIDTRLLCIPAKEHRTGQLARHEQVLCTSRDYSESNSMICIHKTYASTIIAALGRTANNQGQARERQRQSWEHLGAPVTTVGAPRITGKQSGKTTIFFCNAAGAPGNHSFYLWFNNFQNSCIQFGFSSVNKSIYIASHLHAIYLHWQRAVPGAPENDDPVNSDIHYEAVIE